MNRNYLALSGQDGWLDIDDPATWVTVKDRQLVRLFKVQDGICAICGLALPRRCRKVSNNRLSLDHVWPQNRSKLGDERSPPFAGRAKRKTKMWRHSPKPWDKVAAHGKCNSNKSNRPPTGCELIWLIAVRARLDVSEAA